MRRTILLPLLLLVLLGSTTAIAWAAVSTWGIPALPVASSHSVLNATSGSVSLGPDLAISSGESGIPENTAAIWGDSSAARRHALRDRSSCGGKESGTDSPY